MKVLYIGVYRDGTGWSQAATNRILALDEVGVDVVCRPLKLNDRVHEPPLRIQELEDKSSANCDVVIQHVLPHQMEYNGNFDLCVGVYETETSNFRSSVWSDRINIMDLAIVPNLQMVQSSRHSGVTIPIEVVPHACNTEKFQTSYTNLDNLEPFKQNGHFLFYWMGEFVRRKNLAAALKAFHLEFDPSEPVQFIIKTGLPGTTNQEMHKHVVAFCEEIKRGLKLHGGHTHLYKQEIPIVERLTETGVMKLHTACDCFVMPSYGEAWCIPAFDAMAMGNTPIVTDCTGFQQYMSNDCGWLVDCREEPVFGVNDGFEDLYVGTENWCSVDINHLRWCMRQAYNQRDDNTKSFNGIQKAHEFSYEILGTQMKRVLHESLNGRDN